VILLIVCAFADSSAFPRLFPFFLPVQERSGTLVNLALGEQEGTLLSSRTFDGVVVSITTLCFSSISYVASQLVVSMPYSHLVLVLIDACSLPLGMPLVLEVGATEWL